jgi:hypothetical protein
MNVVDLACTSRRSNTVLCAFNFRRPPDVRCASIVPQVHGKHIAQALSVGRFSQEMPHVCNVTMIASPDPVLVAFAPVERMKRVHLVPLRPRLPHERRIERRLVNPPLRRHHRQPGDRRSKATTSRTWSTNWIGSPGGTTRWTVVGVAISRKQSVSRKSANTSMNAVR